MENEWTPDIRLRMRVDEVLHYLWDPIGVSHFPEARDEYYTYSAQAFGMLKNGSTRAELAEYLRRIRVEQMGMGSGPDPREDEIAKILILWKETLLDG